MAEHRAPDGPLAESIELVKEYVRQETLGPLRGAGRWIAFGVLGSLLIGTGTAFVALGSLRLMQTEWASTFDGRWMSLVPYALSLAICLIVAALALMRVSTQPLHRDASVETSPRKENR